MPRRDISNAKYTDRIAEEPTFCLEVLPDFAGVLMD